ncbi:MAG: hypothetical protein ACR2J8_09580 [Thermomicrobiales bacterium]
MALALLLLATGIALVALAQRGQGDNGSVDLADRVDIIRLPVQSLITDSNGIVVTVPDGAAREYAVSGHPFSLPPRIMMRTGQSIEVRNDDSLTHVILGMAVPAGSSKSRTLDRPGFEVYSAGCAAHAKGTELTTLVISAPAAASE